MAGWVAATLAVGVALIASSNLASADPIRAGTTHLVSAFPDGSPADGASPSISSDGRYVAFDSRNQLSSEDTDTKVDVFRKDMQTGDVVLVSKSATGVPFGPDNVKPSISGDGTKVAYLSGQCFSFEISFICSGAYAHVRDISAGTTTRISTQGFRADNVELSRDGTHAAVVEEFDGSLRLVAADTQTGSTTWLAPMCGGCIFRLKASISGTGRFVAFETEYRLVSQDTDDGWDVYLYDRDTDGDGAFDEPGQTSKTLVGILPSGDSPYAQYPGISEDGKVVAFTGALNDLLFGTQQIYARDLQTGTTSLVSQSSLGVPGSGTQLSSDGAISLSSEGRFVAFTSGDPHLAVGDTTLLFDVFLRDRQDGKTYLISVLPDGTQGVGDRFYPTVSSDGRYVAFQTSILGLSPIDRHVYLRDRQTPCSILCIEP